MAEPTATSLSSISLEALPALPTLLTDVQKEMITRVYDSAKTFAQGILNHPTMASAMKVTQLMGVVVKLVESLSVAGKPLSGSDKKAVALQLGRTLIQDIIQDQAAKDVILPIYDMTAESILETLVDVSRTLNVAAKQAAASCCEWMAACLKK